jgi:translation initiation factor 1
MSSDKWRNAARVYSTEHGRVREEPPAAAAAAPSDGVVRVSRTRAGRKGKTVTLVTGLPAAELEATAKELKRVCGAGGAVKDGVVELQGDHRERVVAHLARRHRVKLAGG